MTTGKEAGGVAVETVFYINIQVLNSDLLTKINTRRSKQLLSMHMMSRKRLTTSCQALVLVLVRVRREYQMKTSLS